MKLRNKKTGKIQEIAVMPVIDGYPNEYVLVNGETSLKEFNEEWEDAPAEPLIKDEKVRKAVRAWIERYQKYMPVSLINFEPISGKIVSIEVVATGGDWCKFYPEEYVLEQYTGLKDKNDKEIYEGDIVTLNGEWEKEIEGSIVSFEDGCFRVGNGYENEAGSYLSDWRIIGNIHENPELLGEEE